MSYTSPEAALLAVADAVKPFSRRPVHVGSQSTGATLDCCCDSCDGPLIRVESAQTRAKEGVAGLYGLSKNRCRDLLLDLVVIMSSCFQSFDGDSAEAVAITEATAQGRANVVAWWAVLDVLAATDPLNRSVRFVSASDDDPNGGCFGWTMRLEVDLSLCR
jgi:hypothetical protein